jgi:hypothetical protein
MLPGAVTLSLAAFQLTVNVVDEAFDTLVAPANVGAVMSAKVVPEAWFVLVLTLL